MKLNMIKILVCFAALLSSTAYADMRRHLKNSIIVEGQTPGVGMVHVITRSWGTQLLPGKVISRSTDIKITRGTIVINQRGDTVALHKSCKMRVETGETIEFIGRIDKHGNTDQLYCIHYVSR